MRIIKKMLVLTIIANLMAVDNNISAQEIATFNTKWISVRPEVLTYKVINKKWGEGLCQVSLFKSEETIEVFTNIMLPNFMKLVWGQMSTDMVATQSSSKIIIENQIMMDTKCIYSDSTLKITTQMKPYNTMKETELSFENQIIDFSQIAILLRTLSLKVGDQYSLNSVNPQKNELNPLTINVLREETVRDINCFKVELNTFEGQAFYWIEKESKYRVIRVDQPKDDQITELILND